MNRIIHITGMVLVLLAAIFFFTGLACAQGIRKIDSCTFLTKADIKAVVGQNVGDGKLNAKANPLVGAPCEYAVGTGGAFSILVKAAASGETADKMMAELKKMKIAVSDVPGIGDRSFFSSPGYGMIQLNTFKGPRYFIITMMIPGSTEAAQKSAAEKLMRKALQI